MSRIVQIMITDTEKGATRQRRFVVKNRGQLMAAINTWLTTTAEPELTAATSPEDQEDV